MYATLDEHTHMAAAAVLRIQDGKLQALIISQQDRRKKGGLRKRKMPGGTNKAFLDHDPEDTLERKLSGEAGLFLEEDGYVLLEEATQHKGLHTKYWFLVYKWSGSVRTGIVEDDGDELGIPRWITVKELLGLEGNRPIIESHRHALNLAVQEYYGLCKDDPEAQRAIRESLPHLFGR